MPKRPAPVYAGFTRASNARWMLSPYIIGGLIGLALALFHG